MTVGNLKFERGEWVMTTTPDVAMRLKRMFPRMSQASASELRLQDAADVANDIEWVMMRYPMEMQPALHEMMTRRALAYREHQKHIAAIFTAEGAPADFPMAIPPREYQAVAAKIFLAQGYLLLGDEVGLGKTVSAIAALSSKQVLPAVVVVQAHLPKQWQEEIEKFLPSARVHIIKQSKEYTLPRADIYIISYSKLAAWYGIFAKKIRCVVFDEVQELRKPDSQKYKAAKILAHATPHRLGLSATPIYNYGGEVWNVFHILAPDALGSYEEFTREWCTGWGDKAMVRNPEALGHYLRSNHLFLRRTRTEVSRLLPPIVRYVQEADFDAGIYERSTSAADALAHRILTGSFHERGVAARELSLELRQTTGLAKAPYVAELVNMLVESGERVFLGGWHRAVYDVWMQRLAKHKPVLFTGSESPAQKEKARQAFISGESKVLIMSLRSGAGTNDLQDVCSVCVLGEMDWVPAVHEQFIGRLARDGQKASVQVFIPVAPIGSDPLMATVHGLKQAQALGIVDLGKDDNPDRIETDPDANEGIVRRLAISYLQSRNLPVPTKEEPCTTEK